MLTLTTVEETTVSDTVKAVDEAFDKMLEVTAFFRKIIDAIKSVLTPLFSSLFESIAKK